MWTDYLGSRVCNLRMSRAKPASSVAFNSWPRAARMPPACGGHGPGVAGAGERVGYWAGRSDRDLTDRSWFRVLACYRLGLILEGTHARAFAGLAPVEVGNNLHFMTVYLFHQALQLIG
mgnify:CR=1 FL=1